MTDLVAKLRRALPVSALGWVWLVTGVAGVLSIAAQLRSVLAPLIASPRGYGRQDWDVAETQRALVVKTIRDFHQFPFWQPYACGGHSAWGAIEGGTSVVSPFLPAYLALPLTVAIRVEIVTLALVSAAGAWALASRFTRSQALRALSAVVFAVNGRWALELAVGHTWHLVYALVPWTLFFFDRAVGAEPSLGPPRPRDAVWAGGCLAFMVYLGGRVPLPQTVVLLGVYSLWLTVATRSPRALVALAVAGGVAVGLSAPKLLPVLDEMRRFHPLSDASDKLTFAALSQALFEPDQSVSSTLGEVAKGAWPEVGIYVGTTAAALLVAGLVFARGLREQAWRAIALTLVVLSLGSVHEYAPWPLAHRLPLLSWMDVPSRWLYPAVLLLACVAASAFEGLLVRSGRGRAACEVVLALVVAWSARDIGRTARKPLDESMHAVGPHNPDVTTGSVTEAKLPSSLEYQVDEWAPSTLPAVLANVDVIECHTFPGLDNFPGLASQVTGYDGRPTLLGARGRTDPGYRGEVFVAEGEGLATITSWTPNAVEVSVTGARPGDHVVLDRNWDPGWAVRGADAADYEHMIAGTLHEGTATLRFRYRPRTWWLGLVVWATTVAGIVVTRGRRRGK